MKIEAALKARSMAFFILVALATTPTSADTSHDNQNNNDVTDLNPGKIFNKSPLVNATDTTSIDALAKKLEDDMKERQEKLRAYWQQTFEEIKASNPVVFPSPEEVEANEHKKKLMFDRWKQFLDGGVGSGAYGTSADFDVGENGGKSSGDPTVPERVGGNSPAPLRFDGFRTWEKKLQDWSEEVSQYLAETESQLNEFLQPKEGNAPYDMSTFGISSKNLKNLTSDSTEEEQKSTHWNGSLQSPSSASKQFNRPGIFDTTKTPKGALPIALTALEPNLPTLPQPRSIAPGEAIVPNTDIADKSKNIWIVTTAALPWMTGTAVNPLLRAAYLLTGRKEVGGSVTLMLPWVERPADQERIYGRKDRFESPEVQEEYIRAWLRDSAGMKEASVDLRIRWYTAWQEVAENSLYSMGDIIGLIPEEECDICVLEEPEHLNWYRAPGENWTTKFKHVVGIVHTNYFVYAQEQPAALIRAPGMRLLSSWMCRAHCHRLIKLSGTLGKFAPEKELVENVHGVRRTFLDVGKELKVKLTSADGDTDPVFGPDAEPTVYFIGKMLWSKGLNSLMDLMKYAEESAGLKVKVDMYGGGPNKDEASAKAVKMGLDMPFHGPIDHSELAWTHKVFVNPSLSEVLCTTVAEALAMGKFVVLPSHPSNDFFAQFPNCLPYTNKEEFVGNLYYALTHSPEPLTEEYSYALSWEAATERFAAAGSVSVAEAEAMEEALTSAEAGIDIVLPPLTTNEERRKQITKTFRRTRGRYRNFRAKLSQEIAETSLLPKELQRRLIAELDNRLDVDLDELLSSPKLRVKLSPAKLDKLLLELYNNVAQGPSGDVFRVIGGGANVGRQHQYLKRQKSKPSKMEFDISLISDANDDSTPTNLVKRALKRNFPQGKQKQKTASSLKSALSDTPPSNRIERETPKMSLRCSGVNPRPLSWNLRIVQHSSFVPYRPNPPKYSPLI
mmetsp:Transcript_17555/g.36445  ORF Transcript_17555/g.36445 Transcript_17555/m.36445 type:complete len:956 (+) Transcript_17555:320-3187(+)